MPVADLADALEVAVLGHEAAAAVLHRLEDHGRDRLGPLEQDRLLDLIGRPQLLAILAPAIGVRVRHVMPARRQRLERGAQRGHAGRRQGAHRGAVVGELARDQLRPRRLAPGGVVGLRELPRRLDRLRTPGGEEHAVQIPGRELGDPRGELDRARVGVAPVRVEAELLGLARGGLPELGAAVADVHAVQRRQPVEVALAVLVVHVTAVPADDDRDVAVLVGAHPREVHPQVALRELLKIARH